ncbi:MAG: T9SS type A sorting domain-containing protein [Bacteroidota bacterium]
MSQNLRGFACALLLVGVMAVGDAFAQPPTFTIGSNLPPILTVTNSGSGTLQPMNIANADSVGQGLTVTGGTPVYTYAWQPASLFADPTAAATTVDFADVTSVLEIFRTTTDQNGCTVTDTINVDFSTVRAGLVQLDVALEVFPNPNSGAFTVVLQGAPSAAPLDLLVYDGLGRVVYAEALGRFQGHLTKELNLSDLAKGAYFLSLSREGKQAFTKLMIH